MSGDAVPRVLVQAGLTPREREVFWLIAERLRNRVIAERLYISERTVESHVAALLRKLGGADRTGLITLGVELRERLGAEQGPPQVLSSFVGRDTELAELTELVLARRLVTLVGPAGVGKTRLAFQLARSVTGMPAPILVDLATVAAGSDVTRAFAAAVGLVEDDRGLRASLREALRDDRHWLLVDNCEHVMEACAVLLGDLLSRAEALWVLTTSRSPLRVAGEVVYEVPPLGLPPDSDAPTVVLDVPSVRLFADRAATASPGFAITPENARDAAALCRRLDGLPLAIELAAARIRTFSPGELLSHLDERFPLLEAGALDGPARHRTLDAALRWSYELLGETERLVFERCSVFPGAFDYDTAADVLTYPPVAAEDFTRAFPGLLDRSLLSRRRLGDDTTAYRMLDTFRAFSSQQLERRGGSAEVSDRHATHHIDRAIATAVDLRGSGQLDALRWFDRRWVDLLAAMRWTLARDGTEQAWRLVAGIGRCWDAIGIRGELFDWLEELLDRPLPPGDLGIRARITAGHLLFHTDAHRAVRMATEARDLAPATSRSLHAEAELTLGWALGYRGDRDVATGLLGSALETFQDLDDPWHAALALQGLGHAAGDVETMIGHLRDGERIFAVLGDDVLRANCLNMMAARALEMGDHIDDVEGWLAGARRLTGRTGNLHERLHTELHHACLSQHRGEHGQAAPAFEELLSPLRRIGDHRCVSRCLLGLGTAALEEGDDGAARDHLTAGVALADRVKDPRGAAAGLRLLSQLELRTGHAERAARLLGAADAAADQLDPARRSGLPDDHDLREQISGRIGSTGLRSALEDGRGTAPTALLGLGT